MSMRAGFGLMTLALAGSLFVACGGGGSDGTGDLGERETDPARVPSSTPISQGAPTKYEIHQDGSLTISGGPPIEGTPLTGATAGAGGDTYRVQSGDTCEAIAAQFGITASELIAANRTMVNEGCTNLHEGDELKIPGTTASTPPPGNAASTTTPRAGSNVYVVQSGDTCADIAASYGVSVEDLIALNGLDEGCRTLQPGQEIKIPG